MSATFGDRLAKAMAERGPLCVGIDPHPNLLEQWGLEDSAAGLAAFTEAVYEGCLLYTSEKNGLVVIGWTLDGHRVQTGFRTRYAEDKQAVLRELRRIAPNAVDAPEKWAAEPEA